MFNLYYLMFNKFLYTSVSSAFISINIYKCNSWLDLEPSFLVRLIFIRIDCKRSRYSFHSTLTFILIDTLCGKTYAGKKPLLIATIHGKIFVAYLMPQPCVYTKCEFFYICLHQRSIWMYINKNLFRKPVQTK